MMKVPILAVLLAALSVLAARSAHLEDIQDGPTIAARLRALTPHPDVAQAVLKIRRSSAPTRIVSLTVATEVSTVTDAGHARVWSNTYLTKSAPGFPAESLKVVHRPGQPNLYHYARAADDKGPLPQPQILQGPAAGIAFAQSDFSLIDFGYEFVHWPQQKLLEREMRKGRPCKKLESRPHPEDKYPYSRIVSWIDNETGGILLAEAYDVGGKKLKEFEVKSVRKVEDAYQVQALRMETLPKSSRTLLEFNLGED
jgi:hypothetical protein